jgi:phosphoribosylamine-glycine ligase
MAEKLERAVASAYEAASMVHFEGKQMRRDIARRALDSAAPSHLKRT